MALTSEQETTVATLADALKAAGLTTPEDIAALFVPAKIGNLNTAMERAAAARDRAVSAAEDEFVATTQALQEQVDALKSL